MISGVHLQPELKRAFEELGFSELTDIQREAIPLIQKGKDVIGQSFTGSGKTVAFGFPILEKTVHNKGLQVMILVPTRELCGQVCNEMRKFAKYKRMSIAEVYGGISINPQIQELRHADIVVGTPGRILDHMQRGTLRTIDIKTLVLDEADKMFEMGFIDDIKKIISQLPRERQTLLFSATISHQVHEVVKNYMRNPEKVKVQSYVDKGKLMQYFYSVNSRDKFSLLVHLLKREEPKLTIIFCATRSRVDVLSRNLYKQGINAQPLHGGLSQNRRKRTIEMFHGSKTDVLVASDVAARGLDIKNVSHIINYDIPKTSKEYIHRIGRTARAGEEGKVISLLSEHDHENFRNVLEDRSLVIEQLKLPEFQRIPFFVSDKDRHFGARRDFRPRSGARHGYSQRSSHKYGEHRRPYHQREGRSHEGFGERREYSSESRGSYHSRRFGHS